MISEEVEMTNGFALGVWEKKALGFWTGRIVIFNENVISAGDRNLN